MPFGLIATTSSLWMNLPSASVKFWVPVNSVSAFSSMELATSGLGQSWFGCMYDANSPLADTFTILPGTLRGLKPEGGLAVRASICAASAEAVLARALAAMPAEATRKTSRRETFVDRVERFCISLPSVEFTNSANITRDAALQTPRPVNLALRHQDARRWPTRVPATSGVIDGSGLGTGFAISCHQSRAQSRVHHRRK